jgi:hypothetical protein
MYMVQILLDANVSLELHPLAKSEFYSICIKLVLCMGLRFN